MNFLETSELLTLNTTNEEDFTSFTAQNQVFEGLYTLDAKDNFVPGVAAEMPEISEDQTEYTIKLKKRRQMVRWFPSDCKRFCLRLAKSCRPKNSAWLCGSI
ncbi:family 5 extracellular solute-binding protein [Listeria fleischmannii FSL S10-1203]|uniref:Family 5 extracellular solute-binding protein n=1 Tax=Listeria fleischmannii FSL S10-1203 TaxID=1265822 RepID=W7DDX1_9LIST|nr:family 5 extracellular solute-binding protein [Listeria fleischmannii FSL S10-1203]